MSDLVELNKLLKNKWNIHEQDTKIALLKAFSFKKSSNVDSIYITGDDDPFTVDDDTANLFWTKVREYADKINHHPEYLTNSSVGTIVVRLTTYDAGGTITDLDIKLATFAEELYKELSSPTRNTKSKLDTSYVDDNGERYED